MSQLTRSAGSTLTETPSTVVPALEPSTTASLSTTPAPTSQESEDQQATATTNTTALEADECASATANYDPQEDMHVTSSTLTSATNFHPLSTSTTEDVTSSTDHSRAAPTSSQRKAESLSAGTKAAPALTKEQPDTRAPSQAGDYTLHGIIDRPEATVTTKETPQPSTTTAKSPSASSATETPTPTIRAEEASWRLTPKLILSPDGRFYQLIDAKSNPTCGCSFLMSDGHKCGEVNVWGGRCNYHVGSKDTMQTTSIDVDAFDTWDQTVDAKSRTSCGCSFLMTDGHKCDEKNVWGGRCNYHVGSKDTMHTTNIDVDAFDPWDQTVDANTPDPDWEDPLERMSDQGKVLHFEGQEYQLIGECPDDNWGPSPLAKADYQLCFFEGHVYKVTKENEDKDEDEAQLQERAKPPEVTMTSTAESPSQLSKNATFLSHNEDDRESGKNNKRRKTMASEELQAGLLVHEGQVLHMAPLNFPEGAERQLPEDGDARREMVGLLKLALREAEELVANSRHEHEANTTDFTSHSSPEPQDVTRTANDLSRMQINDGVNPLDKMSESEVAYDKASGTLQLREAHQFKILNDVQGIIRVLQREKMDEGFDKSQSHPADQEIRRLQNVETSISQRINEIRTRRHALHGKMPPVYRLRLEVTFCKIYELKTSEFAILRRPYNDDQLPHGFDQITRAGYPIHAGYGTWKAEQDGPTRCCRCLSGLHLCACPWEASDIVLREFNAVRHAYVKTTDEELQVLKEYRRVRDEHEAAVTVTFDAGPKEDVEKFITRFEIQIGDIIYPEHINRHFSAHVMTKRLGADVRRHLDLMKAQTGQGVQYHWLKKWLIDHYQEPHREAGRGTDQETMNSTNGTPITTPFDSHIVSTCEMRPTRMHVDKSRPEAKEINETRHTISSAPEDVSTTRHVEVTTLSKTRRPEKAPQMIGQDPSGHLFLPPRRRRQPKWLFKNETLLRTPQIMARLMALGIGANNLQDLPWTYEWYTFYKDFPRSGGCAHCESHAMMKGYAHLADIKEHTTVECAKSWITAQYTVYGPDYDLKSHLHRLGQHGSKPPFVQRFLSHGRGKKWASFARRNSGVERSPRTDIHMTPAALAAKQAFIDLCDQYTRPTTTTQDSDLPRDLQPLDLSVVHATAVKNLPPNPLILTPTSVHGVTANENFQDDIDRLQHTHGPRLRTALEDDFTATDARQENFATTTAPPADARPYFDILFDMVDSRLDLGGV